MKQIWLAGMLTALMGATTAAHFVFVVPEGGARRAQVILSETLAPDAEVDVTLIAGTALSFRRTGGADTPLKLEPGAHHFAVQLPDASSGVVHGVTNLGVTARPGAPPHLLLYHPKTIVGDPFDATSRLPDVPVEVVPVKTADGFQLLVLGRGKPQQYAEVTVIGPDGAEGVVRTDADGRTGTFRDSGRYGAWARFWEQTPGTHDGKQYNEVRHYATLVFDTRPAARATAQSDGAAPRAIALKPLPEATSSFGAAEADGWLYVYGGHVSPTHAYSTAAVSGHFARRRLREDAAWEPLPAGPPAQGMNLAAHQGRIYRVGGMQPRNEPGTPSDTRSLDVVGRFDPARGAWEALPALPAPRSSHDVVVVGSRLFVLGGWNLRGRGQSTEWPATMETLDLASPTPSWVSLPQPFKRRALVAAAQGNRIYVIGGFDERSQVVHGVDVFDVTTGTWSTGPVLPGGAMNGFGPAAAVVDGRLVVSVDDGSLHRLNAGGTGWEPIGRASPRIVHRLIADGNRVLILGGARGGTNLDLVEALSVAR